MSNVNKQAVSGGAEATGQADRETQINTLRKIYDAWSNGEVESLLSYSSPSAVYHYNYPGICKRPWEGEFHGPQGLLKFLTQIATVYTPAVRARYIVPVPSEPMTYAVLLDGTLKLNSTGAVLPYVTFGHIVTMDTNNQVVRAKYFDDSATGTAVLDGTWPGEQKQFETPIIGRKGKDNSQQNVQVAQAIYQGFVTGNVTKIFDNVSDDMVAYSNYPGIKSTPWSGVYHGKEEYLQYLMGLKTDSCFVEGPAKWCAAGPDNTVLILWSGTITNKQTGGRIDVAESFHVLTFNEAGKACSYVEITDTATCVALQKGTYMGTSQVEATPAVVADKQTETEMKSGETIV